MALQSRFDRVLRSKLDGTPITDEGRVTSVTDLIPLQVNLRPTTTTATDSLLHAAAAKEHAYAQELDAHEAKVAIAALSATIEKMIRRRANGTKTTGPMSVKEALLRAAALNQNKNIERKQLRGLNRLKNALSEAMDRPEAKETHI